MKMSTANRNFVIKSTFFYNLKLHFAGFGSKLSFEATLWCNGSTNDFGSFSRSSNLCGVAIFLPLKISDAEQELSGK